MSYNAKLYALLVVIGLETLIYQLIFKLICSKNSEIMIITEIYINKNCRLSQIKAKSICL